MSQVRRHDNVQLGPEDLLLSIVGGPGEEAVRIFKIGHRIWVAALARISEAGSMTGWHDTKVTPLREQVRCAPCDANHVRHYDPAAAFRHRH